MAVSRLILIILTVNQPDFTGTGNIFKLTIPLTFKTIFLQYTTCSELVFFGEFNEQSLVVLWVTDARIRGSEKHLPVSVRVL